MGKKRNNKGNSRNKTSSEGQTNKGSLDSSADNKESKEMVVEQPFSQSEEESPVSDNKTPLSSQEQVNYGKDRRNNENDRDKKTYEEANRGRGASSADFEPSYKTKSFSSRRSEPFKSNRFSESSENRRDQNKRHSMNPYGRDRRRSGSRKRSNSRRRSDIGSEKEDKRRLQQEFDEYEQQCRSKKETECEKVQEIESNLFHMSEEYSLAHCVAEDMNMGSGIAVQFRRDFKRVDELLNQRATPGGLAILNDKGRYIYYLVTKRFSSGKPSYFTLFSSLKKLKSHVIANGVEKLAMPRIGCGLDRLQWDNVKFMLEYIFKDSDVKIVICNLQPSEESSQQRYKNSKVINVLYPIQNIETGTIIIYLSSEDGSVSKEMESLDEKFHFLTEFRGARKEIGNVVYFTRNENYLLCGCIVKKNRNDFVDFVALQLCLNNIQKANKKSGFGYVGFQATNDKDHWVNYKIINLMRNILRDVDIYICWPGDLKAHMSPRDTFNLENTDKDNSSGQVPNISKNILGNNNDDNWRTGDSSGWKPATSNPTVSFSQTRGVDEDWDKDMSDVSSKNADHWNNDTTDRTVNPTQTNEEEDWNKEINDANPETDAYWESTSHSKFLTETVTDSNDSAIQDSDDFDNSWNDLSQSNPTPTQHQRIYPQQNKILEDNSWDEPNSTPSQHQGYYAQPDKSDHQVPASSYSQNRDRDYKEKGNDSRGIQHRENMYKRDTWYATKQNKNLPKENDNSRTEHREDTKKSWLGPGHYKRQLNQQNKSNNDHRSKEDTNKINQEFEVYERARTSDKIPKGVVQHGALDSLPPNLSSVCFVSEDGAVPFRNTFKVVLGQLLDQEVKEGDLAVVQNQRNFLYRLVVTASSSAIDIFSTIWRIRKHADQCRVKNIVLPKIKDKKGQWPEIEKMFAFIFKNEAITINVVPHFDETSRPTVIVTHVKSALHQMKKNNIILYLASEDGCLSEEMKTCREFNFDFFTYSKKNFGEVYSSKQNDNVLICVCVVKKSNDQICFVTLQKCISEINKINTEEKLPLLALQAVEDESFAVNFKIVSILKNCLENVKVHMCWPGVLRDKMPLKQ